MSDSDWWLLDLALVIAITGLVTFGLFTSLSGPVRIVLGIPLLLFLPGYAFVAVLYPDAPDDEYRPFDEEPTGREQQLLPSGGIGTIERIALSIVASIAIVPAVTLVASASPWGITVQPLLAGIALVTVALSLLAIGQRFRCPPERRFAPSLSESSMLFSTERDSYGRSAPSPTLYNGIFLVALLVLIATAGFAVATGPADHDGYTEFYLETEDLDGETETMYEDSLSAGESHAVTAFITNEEHEETTYTTVAALQRVSYEEDGVTVQEQDVLASGSATVPNGETQEQTLEVEPTMTGDNLRLVLYLYEGDAPDEPTDDNAYRTIELPVTVS